MGSYCEIYFDRTEVCGAKSVVPDHFCALFQESDRVVRPSRDEDEESPEVVYEAPRAVVLSRLDLLGCTTTVARERLEAWLATTRETWDEYCADGDWAEKTTTALRSFSVEDWYRRAPEVLATLYTREEATDEIDRHMRDRDGEGWLWFDGYGSLMSLRALLDACAEVQCVTLDVTALIGGGWIEPGAKICDEKRASAPLDPRPLATTVILAEGSSDIRILQRSLAGLFPELQDYFSFFNHAELSVDGGAAYLVKFLKAFAAARAPLRLVAVFDNDTAGRQAHRQANTLGLPDNMVAVTLPDTELARSYPTIGPQGEHVVDVNGKAASIELYLGRASLMAGSGFRRVRWSGFNSTAQAYQGEIEGKAEVEASFLRAVANCSSPAEARAAFPELVEVWTMIFSAVEKAAEVAERKLHGRVA
ncbi:hypothetical protein EI171_02865 [Bradyrhizobium sp. LCT2]|uniref:HEPN/Toprim-associated domain-containing protein n=1 Tax=Bradyrhizobium sp. LCT2 TaxID=2493093 RepID=UPI001373A501|nr:HEPN/Toprim-associated domain-containing protein [Bradyrhizobium sp. LCT2]QHP66446.1 hypothetical protein EI171_02865 [Bradyrhizobium sp. LCT2]